MNKDYNSKFVTVLMSVYGEKEEWLRKAVDSILTQTYTNFEFIIILDNPENEFLWGILKEYAQSDHRVILQKNVQNIGLAASLNKGIEISKGDYIVRMDADDISVSHRIETLVKFMERNQEIGVCSSWMKAFDGSFFQNRVVKYPTKHDDLEIRSLYQTPVSHAAAIIRMSIIDNFSPLYNIKCCRSQDYELWSRLMRNGILFSTVSEVLFLRRSSNGIGPQSIPYEIIHNQVSRNNIQLVLNDCSLLIPNLISKSDISKLSEVLRTHTGNRKRKIQLAVILLLYYFSLEVSSIERIVLFFTSGDFFRTVLYLPAKLIWRIMVHTKFSSFSVNNICKDDSFLI